MDGIIILDKESGVYSRTAGARVARLFGEKKFGHIGTLDPMATGVLPIAIGNATKMIPFIEEHNANKKEYLFGLRFGIDTDSLDITGNIVNTNDKIPTGKEIGDACKKILGWTEQVPPQFSAVHINGKRAYELARKGEQVEMKPRPITIYELEYIGKKGEEHNFRVVCSRGTYVRSIVRDIAKLCDTLATTTYIRRTLTNGFEIKNAHTLDFLENLVNNDGAVGKYLLASDCALGDIPVINLDTKAAEFYKNGGFVKTDEKDGFVRVYCDKEFIGIGRTENGLIHPKRTIKTKE
ncbi:MAG: tRNA pseudouridine(55) synthase TruB [Alphaproteobacteria bacterium]|nr:tRNA pseudouridine(55) synthase TruB [Alphaproteobacteria bacterium]